MDLGCCDLIIEVVIEWEIIKIVIFEDLVLYLKLEIILVLNILFILIICFVSCMDWLEKFIGFYFMNLVLVM